MIDRPPYEPVDVPIALTVSALGPATLLLYQLSNGDPFVLAGVLMGSLIGCPVSVLLCGNLLRSDIAGGRRKALGVALLVNLALGGTILALLAWGAIRPR